MTPTAGTPTITLERWIVTARPKALTPFRRVDGEWVTNAKRVRVRRKSGMSMALALVIRHDYASLLTEAEVEFVRAVAKRKGWVLTETRHDLHVASYPYLAGDMDCNADLLAALNRVGRRLGKVIFIRSGRRTMAEQEALYALNMNAATGKPKPGRPLTAKPNANAPHVLGIAADCGIDGRDIGDVPGAVDAMIAEGVGLPVPTEDWHASLGTDMRGAAS